MQSSGPITTGRVSRLWRILRKRVGFVCWTSRWRRVLYLLLPKSCYSLLHFPFDCGTLLWIELLHRGECLLIILIQQGVKQVHKSHLKARYLFLQPPSFEILEKRLRGRATDKEEDIQKRLTQAKIELEYAKTPGAHDKIVINDDKDKAFDEVESFVLKKD